MVTEYLSLTLISAISISYVIGSIPGGIISSKLFNLGDITKIGSGNIGFTNVLRTGSKLAAGTTLVIDAGKGIISIYLAKHFFPNHLIEVAVATYIGSIFSMWLKFKGGKGVATFFGILLLLNWLIAIISMAIWILILKISKVPSLSSLIAIASTPVLFFSFNQKDFFLLFMLFFIVSLITHKDNLKRIIGKKEGKIGKNF